MLYDETQLGYVLYYYRLVGPVRFRQVRISNVSCTERRFLWLNATHDGARRGCHPAMLCWTRREDLLATILFPAGELKPRFDNKDGSCWDDFNPNFEEKNSFGPSKWLLWRLH